MSKVNDIYVIGENEDLAVTLKEQVNESFQLNFHGATDVKKVDAPIILIMNNGETATDDAQMVLSEHPDSWIICLSDEENFNLLRSLNQLGITDFYVLPGEELIFMERLEALAEEVSTKNEKVSETSFRRGGGKIFAFYSGSGGTGKSLISTTFAQTLKLESTAKVLYIDLNLHYGGAETFLGIDSNRSIIDLLPVMDELGEHHIRNVSEKEEHSDLHVLVSPMDAELAEKITDDFVVKLLRASKRHYDFIVVDLPVWMDERTVTVLEEANRVYYTMNLDTVAIRVLKSVENLFQRLGVITQDRLEFVINFKGKDNELTKKDLERFSTYPVASEIRKDIKNVQAYINQGEPIRKEPREKKLHPFSKDIHKWVHSMLK
ncbi:pilus assembly protein CpaE [Lentibacillus halodurans]|uniref:Pilus assembly protein CpaE n=1 Tax=Lentibacillus halodurans TaxID=237679 RepID=A0A1I0WQ90_9BACI|nr:AAA family ATPase [Lentibacillus halodurans]SFA90935.1 pilus assembly protein CpaE [Lentibacillus halodurans]